jgi:hypothetical protein
MLAIHDLVKLSALTNDTARFSSELVQLKQLMCQTTQFRLHTELNMVQNRAHETTIDTPLLPSRKECSNNCPCLLHGTGHHCEFVRKHAGRHQNLKAQHAAKNIRLQHSALITNHQRPRTAQIVQRLRNLALDVRTATETGGKCFVNDQSLRVGLHVQQRVCREHVFGPVRTWNGRLYLLQLKAPPPHNT